MKTAYNVRFGVRRADVLGRNIVPIFPPERQAAGTLYAILRQCVGQERFTIIIDEKTKNQREQKD
jgi:hypothetical protein